MHYYNIQECIWTILYIAGYGRGIAKFKIYMSIPGEWEKILLTRCYMHKDGMHKVIALGIFISMMMLTAPNAYEISIGFSRGEQQAAKNFQNHSPLNSACGKHTSYYCAGWVKGYTTEWNSLVQTNPHTVPAPPTESSVVCSYYCAEVKGYTTEWNSLVQTNPHTVPAPPTESSVKANISSIPSSNSTGTISIHTVNAIQGSNSTILVQEEPGIRKAILSDVDNAIFIAKGSVKSAIPVNVNAKIINQLTTGGVDTTQGIDMTKKIIAIELTNVINTIASNFASHRIAVDNHAICNGIASPTK